MLTSQKERKRNKRIKQQTKFSNENENKPETLSNGSCREKETQVKRVLQFEKYKCHKKNNLC